MKLITNAEQLAKYLPNVLQTVKGETPLLDKLASFLDAAEDWVINTFTSAKSFNTICGYATDNPIRQTTERLVVAEAMWRAIPSLDLVLTPNGFAVVNSSNLAPASRARVDSLRQSMLEMSNEAITALLPQLPSVSQWLNSEQASFFGATLFPDLFVGEEVAPKEPDRWHCYLDIRPTIKLYESQLAEAYLSPELMEEMRYRTLRRMHSADFDHVISRTRNVIVAMLKGAPIDEQRMTDIVNYIRKRPSAFPEWHRSETAALFAPPVFENKKQSTGYFF